MEANSPSVYKGQEWKFGPQNAIDGKNNTIFKIEQDEPWILIKLAAIRTITGLHIFTKVFPSKFEIRAGTQQPDRDIFKALNDAHTKVVFNLHTDKKKQSQTFTFFDRVDARYLIIRSLDSKSMEIQDIKLFEASGMFFLYIF